MNFQKSTQLFSSFLLIIFISQIEAYEGFGSVTKGALDTADYETCHVTSLDDAGAGTLRDAVSQAGRLIVFDVGGTINLESALNIAYPYTTIDGLSAPDPGITLNTPNIRTCIESRNSVGSAHDIIIHHIRVKGAGGNGEGLDILELDGMKHPVYNIVFDHITGIAASDGVFDIYGGVHDVTISNCLMMETIKMCHLSNSDYVRKNISFHHNVFAKNNERQIRMRHHNELVDFVNNVVYGWGWFEGGAAGFSIDENIGVSNEDFPVMNVENNIYHFVAGLHGEEDEAIRRVVNGKIYFSGNRFPDGEKDDNSTSDKHTIPAEAVVTMHPVSVLGDSVVPFVGTHYPTVEETALLQEIRLAVNGTNSILQPKTVPHLNHMNSGTTYGYYNIRGQFFKQVFRGNAVKDRHIPAGVYMCAPETGGPAVRSKLIIVQ